MNTSTNTPLSPKKFCEKLGFTFEVEETGQGKHLIHILDAEKQIYKSGKREGSFIIPLKHLTKALRKAENDLMWLVLDRVFE